MKSFWLIALFCCFSMASCSAQKTNTGSNDSGYAAVRGKWLLMSMRIDSSLQELPSLDMFAVFDPDGGRVTGKGACNHFFGSLKLDGTKLSIGPLGGTMMACEGLNMEQKFLHLLQSTDGFKQDGERLLLQAGGKTVLEMIPYPAKNVMLDEGMTEPNTPLDTYSWSFMEMSSADSVVGISTLKARISFDPAGNKFQGFAGCNRFFGALIVQSQFNSGELQLKNIGSTKMACPQLSLESKLLQGLQTITRYEVRNKTLLLFNQHKQVFVLRADPAKE